MCNSARIGIIAFLLAVLVAAFVCRPRPDLVRVRVVFVGFTDPLVYGARQPQDPWGTFTISNVGPKPVSWSAGTEAPSDPTLYLASAFCSFSPRGTLPPFSSCQHSWPVPGAPGQRFRAFVSYDSGRRSWGDIWYKFRRDAPIISRLWYPKPRPQAMTIVYSDWQTTPNNSHDPTRPCTSVSDDL
jgi:hypothetical protein